MKHTPLKLGLIWNYAQPRIAFGIMWMLFNTYLMKFATDELLIAPAVMGAILAIVRLWDAVSDPMVGYLSDRTRSRLGRRRSWMFYSALPMGIFLVMIWAPPMSLGGWTMALWIALALILYETANTAFAVPHGALGVELTTNYHERTRLFGWVHMIGAIGTVLGLIALELMNQAEDKREFALYLSTVAGVCILGSVMWCVWRVPESISYQGRGSRKMIKSMMDVLRNKHSRLLLLFLAIESFGAASVGMVAPYIVQYVVSLELVLLITVYSVPQFALTPLWMKIARHTGKKHLWAAAMWVNATTFFAWFFFLAPGEPSLWVWPLAFLLGTAAGVGGVMAPAIQADIVDYDEFMTKERKEGSYIAFWNLVRKISLSVAALVLGFVLQFTGFEPNVEQSEATQTALRSLIALLPAACYAVGALLFMRFTFNEKEHASVRAVLDERAADAPDTRN